MDINFIGIVIIMVMVEINRVLVNSGIMLKVFWDVIWFVCMVVWGFYWELKKNLVNGIFLKNWKVLNVIEKMMLMVVRMVSVV